MIMTRGECMDSFQQADMCTELSAGNIVLGETKEEAHSEEQP